MYIHMQTLLLLRIQERMQSYISPLMFMHLKGFEPLCLSAADSKPAAATGYAISAIRKV